jgi:hypothetical protein
MRPSSSWLHAFPAVTIMLAVLLLTPGRADAVTLKEIIDLTRAGVSEEVLLALIEIDQRVFPIDPATLNELKRAGVSERVMVAIVKSGRTPAPAPDPVMMVPPPDAVPPPEPQVVVIEHERPVIQEVAVPVPVYVVVPRGRSRSHSTGTTYSEIRTPFVPFGPVPAAPVYDTTPHDRPHQRKPAEPVYWGWGGKLRPDAWKPSGNQK